MQSQSNNAGPSCVRPGRALSRFLDLDPPDMSGAGAADASVKALDDLRSVFGLSAAVLGQWQAMFWLDCADVSGAHGHHSGVPACSEGKHPVAMPEYRHIYMTLTSCESSSPDLARSAVPRCSKRVI